MQANIAVGLIETSSIAKGIETADAMCKAAGVELFISAGIPRGKYIIVVTGPVGEVESALLAGREMAGAALLEHFIIRNIHKDVYAALTRKNPADAFESVGVVETKDAMPAIFAADAACKAASVRLIEVRTGIGIGGKGFFSICGEPGAVRTALSAATAAIGEQRLVSRIFLPQANQQLAKAL